MTKVMFKAPSGRWFELYCTPQTLKELRKRELEGVDMATKPNAAMPQLLVPLLETD